MQPSFPSSVLAARTLGGLAASFAIFSALPARAHIIMEGVLQGRSGDQKASPCEGLPRSTTPNEFEPGATIRLAVIEGIPHDGYFRISFDDDGTDFKDPQSIKPINPDRYGTGQACQGTPEDHCGESDFCNMVSDGHGPTVLWDQLDPHLGTSVSFGQVREWRVKLPNIECDNCTIQVMQVMEDPAGGAHGPFDGMHDLYYRCVDVVLRKGVGNTPGTVTDPVANQGIECSKQSTGNPPAESDGGTAAADAGAASDAGAPTTGDDKDDDGGCSVSSAPRRTGALASPWLLLLAVFGWRRRAHSRSAR